MEDVKTFTYLGSLTDEHGGSDADVKARIGKSRAAYLQLKDTWNSKQLSTNTKVKIFSINVNVKMGTQGKLETFVYLVSIIGEHGGSDTDVNARGIKTKTTFL
ncbi:unnamed protein product [Schistosoma mattheei]|uniref:DUF6451 domain-containing protein n=1 Tax=Schistosoma mattheei TaxID=31246 RepID=A0A3P8B7N0_9TREM|nr:unnamed protein product [Schistosoma mattheei]